MSTSMIKSDDSQVKRQFLAHGAVFIFFNLNPSLKKWYQEYVVEMHVAIFMIFLLVPFFTLKK